MGEKYWYIKNVGIIGSKHIVIFFYINARPDRDLDTYKYVGFAIFDI